jgi:hypothetical protein
MSLDHHDAAPLDGNAAASLLSELFARDLTAAEIVCGGCGAAAALGAVRLYSGSMGAILRCVQCNTAMLRLTHTPDGLRLDMRGARTLFVALPRE